MKDGTVETVVAAMIEVDWLSRIAVEIGAANGADVLLLDSTGTVVAAYPQPESWVGQNLAELSAALKGPDGTDRFEGPRTARERIVGHVRLRDTNAVLAVTMPLSGVTADATQLAWYEIGKILLAEWCRS